MGLNIIVSALQIVKYSANEGYILNGHFYYKRHYLWGTSTSILGTRGVVYDKMRNEGGCRKFDNFFNPSFQPFVYMFDQCPYRSNFHYFIINIACNKNYFKNMNGFSFLKSETKTQSEIYILLCHHIC